MEQNLHETEKAGIFHFEIFKYINIKNMFKNLIFVWVLKTYCKVIFLHRKFQTGNGNLTRLKSLWNSESSAEGSGS